MPIVTIIIPCRNEENFIVKCLDSIVLQDYSKVNLEIIVIDGMSEDGTKGLVEKYSKKYAFIKLIDNPKKIVSAALNIGIQNAQGEIIIRMDAHNIYEKNYISLCVKYLQENDVANVGGICITLPGSNTLISRSIASVLSHFFGVGNSYFRIGINQLKYVDTVPFGCYKKEIFQKIGLFDEDLVRNQDDEFNSRLIKNGEKILLVPEIISYYYSRDSLIKLSKMYWQYGYFKPLVNQKIGGILTWRQTIPSVLVSLLVFTGILSIFGKSFLWLFLSIMSLYVLGNIFISFSVSVKKDIKLLPFLFISFATVHFSYGCGYLKGILDFIVLNKNNRKKIKNISLTR